MVSLFDPISIGAISAPNRIVMAPLTRGRATQAHVPLPRMIDYYRQRASAGLIISEATGISREGLGWPHAPGIWTAEMREAWKPVTAAVHQAGGRIVLQLWHMGRIVHPSFLDGALPVSASATTAPGQAHTNSGKQDFVAARPLEVAEVPRLIDDYVKAARNAMQAGFDGVQIHGANGYLIDQFLRDGSNLRDDEYGGSVDNRIRLLREVTAAVAGEVGADRTGVRLSPNGESQGVDDSDPATLFGAAAKALDDIGIAFLELRQPGPDGTFGRTNVPRQSGVIRAAYSGTLILNSDYDVARANADLASGAADAISFGRPFIANPDLPARIAAGQTMADWAQAAVPDWYMPVDKGYADWPNMDGAIA